MKRRKKMYSKEFIIWLVSQTDYEFMGYCRSRDRYEWYENFSVATTLSFWEMYKKWCELKNEN